MPELPQDLHNLIIYCVGIKGTGMTALVEILSSRGAQIRGSDVTDTFYTDGILGDLGISVFQGFSEDNLQLPVDLLIYSAAYDPGTHPELVKAKTLGIPILPYNQALGQLSSHQDSSGIAGVHGKTTTTAMVGVLVQALGLSGTVLTGSGVANFGGRSVLTQGDDFFVAETCEYRRHFLSFHPRRIILTSVEPDHQDYFSQPGDIDRAFLEYGQRLSQGGALIYCYDDPGAREVAQKLASLRPDIRFLPYGFLNPRGYRITNHRVGQGYQQFALEFPAQNPLEEPQTYQFTLKVPGRHNVLNASAALVLVLTILHDRGGRTNEPALARGLESFRGTNRRSEIIGQAGGVLLLDDYGHHPRAIRSTLEGFKEFYPNRRLVVSFMSHTYSRTAALLDEFAQSFGAADLVILHDIYASARETLVPGVTGEALAQRTKGYHSGVSFLANPVQSAPQICQLLNPGDVFVTMGAGDNWKLGRRLLALLEEKETT